ncbi:hypothetical protein [Streptomyces sp. NPDC048606]|uniref:hypothetical protein n=1 Tax=Streptomyces sp. NPDC048606 TaxID=3154726 RepID=UPI0034158485
MTTSTPGPTTLDEPGPPPPRRPRRHPLRVVTAVLSALLGSGLLAGAAATAWSEHRAAHRPLPPDAAYRKAASLWREAPVDRLFPPVIDAERSGPGGADRTWTRTALAPDADCPAGLAADWRTAFAATDCTRVLRATYTDATRSSLVSVGLVFTAADAPTLAGLAPRLGAPPAFGYADSRRAAWTATALPGAPVVVYAVSAFADGRAMDAPVPAEEAAREDAEGVVAEAGLGHAARAVATRIGLDVGALAAPPAPAGTSVPDTPEHRR